MSETMAIQMIGAAQAVIIALIGLVGIYLGKNVRSVQSDMVKVKKDAAAARWQVENTHDTNLREENDSRHGETQDWFSKIEKQFNGVAKDISGIRTELRDDRQATRTELSATREAIHQLETRVDTVTSEIAAVTGQVAIITNSLLEEDKK